MFKSFNECIRNKSTQFILSSYIPSSCNILSKKNYLQNAFLCVNNKTIIKSQSNIDKHFFSTHQEPALQTDTNLSPLTTRRKLKCSNELNSQNNQFCFDTCAYAISENLNLENIKAAFLEHGIYSVNTLPDDVTDALHVEANYRLDTEPREIFIYRDGCIVFWNLPPDERKAVLGFLRPHQRKKYDSDLIHEEYEMLSYVYNDKDTGLNGSEIHFQSKPNVNYGDKVDCRALEKYSFSNALSLSVKLSIWESKMDNYVESMQCMLDDLKTGKKIKLSRADVLRKSGELFTIRHLVNLRSDLLDTPDFYWDRESLEPLFRRTFNHLSIARRTKVMNEKLTHCCDILAVVRDHLNGQHSTRLEWIIIILIAIEIMFEVIHTIK